MLLMKQKVPRILELAERIAEDIRLKKLKPGDPYQGTTETAEMLGVSTTAANSAMQVLVKRRIIERRQRRGTFVAVPPADTPRSPLKRVHLVVQENYLRTEGLLSDGIIVGMHDELPATQVQFNFTPSDNDAAFMSELIAEAMRSQKTEGFVLVRSSLAVQRLASASGLPVVVHGSLSWSVPNMPWIDRDHRSSGRLLTTHLLDEGFKNIVVLMRDRMFRGDHLLVDSIRETAFAAGVPTNKLIMRCLPSDSNAIAAATQEMIELFGGEPFAVICRSEPLAAGVEAAAIAAKLKIGRDIQLVISDVYRKGSESPPAWPHIRSVLTPEQIGQHIGRLLAQQAVGKPVDPDHEVIPVTLHIPDKNK